MSEYDRFRVRRAHQTWNDQGPDLLRQRDNAVASLRNLIGGKHDGLFVRKNQNDHKGEWHGPFSKAQTVNLFESWREVTNEFVIGHKDGEGEPTAWIDIARVDVKKLDLPNCSPETILLHSLIHAQFPHIIFAGGYMYRQIAGSSSWSDHAWGTAIDESANEPKGQHNDECIEWLSRMGKSGNARFDYALGSRNGNVVQAGKPDYQIESSDAADTHLWHTHISITDHDGRKPPRQGGVW